ncbi:MAG: sodium:proton antiporter NhaD [Saprospiraceae bacterium]|nr:sodium:proton antiporter NhaD [Saprospiraceae bacterium]MDZ4705602.1 sodium:proton antiporter NhaD [Saprospiraceae bacterium]
MLTGVIVCFIVGYLTIAFEHPLKLDKTVPALVMGALCWAMISIGHLGIVGDHDAVITYGGDPEQYFDGLNVVLLHHVGKIAEILFFLIGAMTIVELVDLHKGFSVITSKIKTDSKRKMLIIICILAFFLSAILDNLTTTIVLISLLRKLVPNREDRLWFASMVVIAANAGGAWSPIGDVTTTMLWINKKVSTMALVEMLFIPSVVCLAIPLLVLYFSKNFAGKLALPDLNLSGEKEKQKLLSSNVMFFAGIGALIFVPIFKSLTHLPPYVGMALGLGVVWLISEYIHPEEDFTEERKQKYTALHALSRIEMSSILFFLGILLAVGALETIMVTGADGKAMGLLASLALNLETAVPDQNIVIILIGVLSAVVDNVPIVAATMGMYKNPIDDNLWHFIAYSAGTGGSMLIIGSAAGVAAMGMERIDFIWYMKKIAWLAALGFLAGALTFILLTNI